MDDDQTDPGSKPGHEQPETPQAQAQSPQGDLNSAAAHEDDPTLPESAPVVPEQSTEAPPSKQDVELLTPKPASPPPPAQDTTDSAAPDPPSSSSAMLLDDPPPPPGPPQASSARPSPVDPNRYAPPDRPLNVTDALSYLDAVKVRFQDQPDVYNQFLDIMKEFKNELIDTPGVIMRVSQLFHGHPSLIQGFNTFLPVGYRIECSTDAQESSFITVTTPSGTTTQATNEVPSRAPHWPAAGAAVVDAARQDAYPPSMASPDPKAYGVDGQAIEPAVQYVQKIKQRCDPETYRQFLDILSQYHSKPDAIDEDSTIQDEVSKQIARLFKDDPDLRSDFRIFMPERSQQLMDDAMISPPENRTRTGTPSYETKGKRKLETATSTSALPPRRKRKAVEREREHETVAIKQTATTTTVTATASISRVGRLRAHRNVFADVTEATKSKYATGQDLTPASYATSKQREVPQQPPPPPSPLRRPSQLPPPSGRALPGGEDAQFFDRVKRFVDNRETYNEFLKVVNLFTQDYIDMARLVKESRAFLGDGELMKQFKDILGWSERQEREHYLQEQQSQHGWTRPTIAGIQGRPSRADLSVKYGSYRRLPESEINVACSGRDEMCRSVLNDEWISHPTWSSEDSGFIAHKKNIYEEALHRSEEERHEYDFHIEAIVRTIAMLEPINNKIAQLSPDERGNFKLKPNLGGSWKSIHQRVIKKIYGRAAGLEVIQAMQDSPALAIPVVLQRLKQKEEEWKRAQREWNKVWRDVDARNYIKSLDHQSIYFKSTDKKSLTTKAFLSQIEAAREEQMAKRASFIDPLFARTRPRHQLEFTVGDVQVLQDALKLTFSYLDRVQTQVNFGDRRRIEGFLRSFVPLFFALDPVAFNAAFVVVQETVDSEMSDDMGSVVDDEIGGSSGGTSLKNSRASGGGASGNRRAGSSSGDLRKKLLKSEQAKSTSRKTRAQDAASPSISRLASPVLGDEEHRDLVSQARKQARRNIFFTNLTFYVLLRLIEVLYSRLKLFKDLGNKMAAEGPRNPRAAAPNGLPYLADLSAFGDRATNAEHYYELLLETCERLFDNEIEQHAFEDQIRAMFSIKDAYKIFTVDKVIGAIVKQVQAVFNDPKNQELLEILKRERSLASPTTQDQINSRRNTEKVLGPDENLFRIDWLPESKVITIQLIGKDDSSFDDSEVLTGRWQAYIESFVSNDTTEGVNPSKVRLPYLRRNLPAAIRNVPPDVVTQDGLEIKICVRTYRLFFVSNTEDFMRRFAGEEEVQKASENVRRRELLRARWVATAKDD